MAVRLFSLDIAKAYVSFGLCCDFSGKLEVDSFILAHCEGQGFFGSGEVVANEAHFGKENDVELTLRCVLLQRNAPSINRRLFLFENRGYLAKKSFEIADGLALCSLHLKKIIVIKIFAR